MAVPKSNVLFDEKAADTDTTPSDGIDTSAYGMKAFAVKTTGFSGTLNLVGQHYRGQSDWRVLRYRTLTPGSGNPSAASDTAPDFFNDTGYRVYLVNDPWHVVAASITDYAQGTITVTYLFTDVPVGDVGSGGDVGERRDFDNPSASEDGESSPYTLDPNERMWVNIGAAKPITDLLQQILQEMKAIREMTELTSGI